MLVYFGLALPEEDRRRSRLRPRIRVLVAIAYLVIGVCWLLSAALGFDTAGAFGWVFGVAFLVLGAGYLWEIKASSQTDGRGDR